ncbi:MAG: CoA transferase subunit A [Planctomycetes bacterium]|jgi:glutaconate CoA-transferase subunit A|nr:CoA transferase subunit A [Planctomycetota bacterium]
MTVPLYADPSANRAREFFRTKPRALVDKVASVKDAVTNLVSDGDYLAVGGFGADRLPSAICHEIVRQNKQNLTLAGHTATHDFQILAAGNLTGRGKLIARVDSAYIVGLEARGLSPHARRVMESGEVESTEWSNYSLAVRFKAAAMGLPFLPMRSMLGTDTLKRSPAKEIVCPFTGEKLLAVPACYPDVGVIHVHESDRYGNCRIRGTSVADIDLARASKKLIVTCERLIPSDEIRSDPTRTVVPFYCVDAVCEVPFGSYPGNMPYEYFSDEVHIRHWLEIEADEAKYKKFIDTYIHGVRDFAEYLQLCGGLPRLQELRQEEFLLNRGK